MTQNKTSKNPKISREKELETVLEISQAISRTLSLDKILEMACKMTAQALGADRCSIGLVFEKHIYSIAHSYRRSSSYPSIEGMQFDLSKYPHLASALFKRKQIHLFDLNKITLSIEEKRLFRHFGYKVFLGVPIVVQGDVLGAFHISKVRESLPFSSSQIKLCQTIANEVGLAVKNAKLIKQFIEEHQLLKAARQQVLAANKRLHHLMLSTSVVIYSAKTFGDYQATFITENIRRMIGFAPQQFIRDSSFWIDHVHPEEVPRLLNDLPIVLKEGHHTYEYRFRCKNGKYIWVCDEMNLVRNAKEQPVEIIGYWMDITQSKKVEAAVRESEDKYHRIFEDSPISLWEEDFSSVKNYFDSLKSSGVKYFRAYFDNHPEEVAKCAAMVRVVAVNKTTLNWFEAKSLEELKSGLDRVFTQESYEVFKEGLVAIAEGKNNFESDAINQTLKGKNIDINIRWSVLTGYETSLSRLLVSIVDITERKLAEKQLTFLANRVIEAQEEERRMTSQKLHDSLVQDLTAIKLDLKMCLRSSPKEYVQIISRLEDDEKLLTQTMENLRDLSSDLRPRILDELGLFSALRWYVDKFRQRTNIKVQLRITGSKKRLSPEKEIGIYRIIQEGLTNIAKHSEARSASLSVSARAGYVGMVIKDNGIGFEPESVGTPTSYGLLRMMENTKLLGGKFKVISSKGKGTKLSITIPY